MAERIRESKRALAERVTDTFLANHPDWVARYGPRTRRFGIEDACFHFDFLAAAVEAGSIAAFADYACWATRILIHRGLPAEALEENLGQVGRAAAQLDESFSSWIESCTRAAATACRQSTMGRLPTASNESQLKSLQRLFAEAIRGGNRTAATNLVLQAIRDGHRLADIYVDVVQESLYEIGRLWEENKITVADEHMATAVAQFVIAQIYPLIEPLPQSRGRMVITGVEGEQHQIGANIVADFLELHGWSVRFLGVNTPHSGVMRAVDEHQATVVGISATMLFSLPRVVDLTLDLRQAFPNRIRILLGGAAVRIAPSIAQDIGADAWAHDLRSALETADRLIRI